MRRGSRPCSIAPGNALGALLLTAALAVGLTGVALADGNAILGPPSIAIAAGSGVSVGGTGLVSQPGTLDITVPGGVTINQTLLYWEGRGAPDDTIVVDGNLITGTLIGQSAPGLTNVSSAYRADITALGLVAPGFNSLTVSGLTFGHRNDGAGILAIWDDGTASSVDIRDGDDFVWMDGPNADLQNAVAQTFNFDPAGADRTAKYYMFVADGTNFRPDDLVITTSAGDTTTCNEARGRNGESYDAFGVDVTVPAGSSSVTVQPFSRDDNCGFGSQPDSFAWHVGAFVIETVAVCGDGQINQPGETCDPPGSPAGASGNECRDDCTVCGDGVLDAGEECDDGNNDNFDGCRNDCLLPICGDGILDPGETCDPPGSPAGASGNDCRGDCTVCGDGIQQAGEECDDGNNNNNDGCRNDCSLPICGDGILDPGETCDPPGEPAGQPNECRDNCTFCGDGVLDAGEECDDGNNDPGDGCTPMCMLCTGMIGDFVWNDGEIGRDCDGIQPGDGTSGINGVTVRLLDGGGFLLQEQLTHVGPGGMDGYYKFSDLCAGDYTVEVLTPAGFVPAPSLVGDPADDSNGSPAGVTLPADDSMDLTIDFGYCTEAGDQGCTPGYWKVPQHWDSWIPTGYTTGQSVTSVFSEAGAYPEGAASMVEALDFPGGPGVRGAVRILLRAAVAAVLNASHPDVNYPTGEAGVINKVNNALASGDRDKMLKLAGDLDDDNNLGCPLN